MRSTKKPTTPPTAQAEIYGECKDNSDSAKFEELKGSNKGGFCRFADQGVPSKSDFDGYTCDKECCRSKCEADADCTAFEFSSSSYDVCEVHFGAVAESSGSYTSTNKAYCGVRCPYFTSTTFTATTATSTSATSTTFTPTLLNLHDQCDPRADLCNVAKDLVCQPDTYKCLYASTASTESPGVAEGGARKGLSKAALTAIALLLVAVMLSVGGAVYYRRKYRTAQQHAAMVRGDIQTTEFINPAYNLSLTSSSIPATAMTAGAAVIGTPRVADIGASTLSSVSINAAPGSPRGSSAHATVLPRAGAGALDPGAGFGVGADVAGAVLSEEMLPQRHNQPNQEEVKGSSSPSSGMVGAAPPPYESTAAHQPHDGVSSGVADDADDDRGCTSTV